MNKRKELRQYLSEHINNWIASGMSKSSYCNKHGLAYQKFTYFYNKYHKGTDNPASLKSRFIKIQEPELTRISAEVEFHFPDGRYFIFHAGTPVKLIKEILS